MGREVDLADARAFIANSVFQTESETTSSLLGSIRLRPHQQSAIVRLRSAITEFGGALLCDEVGMGKTFVALAIARGTVAHVIAPAVLRDMWAKAAECSNSPM